MIRKGALHDRWPATFPSGQGSDFAGVVAQAGGGVQTVTVGDEVLGFTDQRASHAEFVVVPARQVTAKPAAVPWEVAGALFVAGTTAYAAVRAVDLKAGDTVAISGAAGGVGSIAVQLAKRAGAKVLGIAGPSNDSWLSGRGIVAINYGPDLARRLKAAAANGSIDAFLDFFGGGYVDLAMTELGLPPQRVNTIIDFAAVDKFGVKAAGSRDASDAAVLAELANLVAAGELDVPIAQVFALDEVRQAYRTLEQRHTRGKIVLRP
jgi:NADPH:quinone reductase-like Zn-dependent oxidoreductase